MPFKKWFYRFRSFTLIEIVVTVAVITILASIVLLAIDPIQRFADARNVRRMAEIKSILEAVKDYEIRTGNQVPGIESRLRMLGRDLFGCGVRCGGDRQTFSARVAASRDDAEEKQLSDRQYMYITSTDLELVNEGTVPQKVGIRFRNVTLPQGASILSAFIEFTVDELDSGLTRLMFYGEAADNSLEFGNFDSNISLRSKTRASTPWNNLSPWTRYGDRHQTPNLASLVQEVINRPGWTPGNALTFIVEGTGERTAHAFDGNPSFAPLLTLEYASEMTQEACLDLSGILTGFNPFPYDPRGGTEFKTYYALKAIGPNNIKVVACGAEGGEVIELSR